MEELDALIAQAATAADPQDVALQVMVCATGATKTAEIAWDVYLVWAGLTEVWEEQQDERSEALIRQAASEWLAATDDAERREHLDRWQYEILGYKRKVPKGWTLVVEQEPDGSYRAHAEDPVGRSVDAAAPTLETVWEDVRRQAFANEGDRYLLPLGGRGKSESTARLRRRLRSCRTLSYAGAGT